MGKASDLDVLAVDTAVVLEEAAGQSSSDVSVPLHWTWSRQMTRPYPP